MRDLMKLGPAVHPRKHATRPGRRGHRLGYPPPRRAPAWRSDRTPLRAPYVVPLLGVGNAWRTGHRAYNAGWPLRLLPRGAA